MRAVPIPLYETRYANRMSPCSTRGATAATKLRCGARSPPRTPKNVSREMRSVAPGTSATGPELCLRRTGDNDESHQNQLRGGLAMKESYVAWSRSRSRGQLGWSSPRMHCIGEAEATVSRGSELHHTALSLLLTLSSRLFRSSKQRVGRTEPIALSTWSGRGNGSSSSAFPNAGVFRICIDQLPTFASHGLRSSRDCSRLARAQSPNARASQCWMSWSTKETPWAPLIGCKQSLPATRQARRVCSSPAHRQPKPHGRPVVPHPYRTRFATKTRPSPNRMTNAHRVHHRNAADTTVRTNGAHLLRHSGRSPRRDCAPAVQAQHRSRAPTDHSAPRLAPSHGRRAPTRESQRRHATW